MKTIGVSRIQSMFQEQFITAHFDRKISFLISFTETPHKIFHFISKNFIDPKSPYFHYFFPTFHNFLPQSFLFHPSRHSDDFLVLNTNYTYFSRLSLSPYYLSLQKHPFITAQFISSLHILCITAR